MFLCLHEIPKMLGSKSNLVSSVFFNQEFVLHSVEEKQPQKLFGEKKKKKHKNHPKTADSRAPPFPIDFLSQAPPTPLVDPLHWLTTSESIWVYWPALGVVAPTEEGSFWKFLHPLYDRAFSRVSKKPPSTPPKVQLLSSK